MKAIKYTLIILSMLFMAGRVYSQYNEDSLLAIKAIRTLKKTNTTNVISVVFGTASNIEMIIIGGFPMEVDDGMNPGLNISHMCLAIPRVATSIYPPIGVSKTRKMLEPWRNSPEMAESCQKLFARLDAAQVLTALAPVLCISGGIMMATASTSMEYHEEYNNGMYNGSIEPSHPGLKIAGWTCVGAGLVASLSSAILLSHAKKDLQQKLGTFRLNAGVTYLGLQYNLPVKN